MTALQQLARFVAEGEIAPDENTVGIARDALIDTLGCVLAGTSQPVAKQTRATLSGWGRGLAPVLGTDVCLPAPWAAMANAVAGHALDFDDWEIPGNTHVSGVLFPALLAVAAGAPCAGRAILEGYIAGFEVIARVGKAVNYEHYANGWHATATLGALGAAAAVARLRGLDRVQAANAMSIALSQAVGYICQFGSSAKPLQAGFAAKAGVVATALAENGLAGQPDVLEHPTGFNKLMAHGDTERFFADFQPPGDRLALAEYGLVIKPYPTCAYSHRLIDCALALRPQLTVDPAQIVGITASLPDFHAAIMPFQQPTTRAEALFSLPFCVALALVDGQVTLANLETAPWTDATIIDLIAKVTLRIHPPKNPALNYDPDDPDWLEIDMANGTRYRTEVAFPLGTPQNRMTSEQILNKFLSNVAFGVDYMAPKHPAISALKQWEQAPDINAVIALL
ncbi:MAG: MmgE/PrpD family protein [Ardenticatenaceae bacterium]